MYIKEAELINFRNYENLKLKFDEKVNIFIGDNAQGKTNLLEGIYISSFGRSFRYGKDNEMIKFGEKYGRAKITAQKDGEETCVEIVISEKEKGVKINGVKIKKTAELLENILIVVFSPDDLRIVKGDPERRRNFLDREISQIKPSYYSALSSYKRALAQRNALLKSGGASQADFDIWDKKLAEYGTKIILKRIEFIEKLKKIAGEIHKKITNEKENFEVIYESGAIADEEAFILKLKDTLKSDIFRGYTQTGPHRDDLIMLVNGTDLRKFGSQGQQRSAALSLKLSELRLIKEETGEEAVLLLDDVLSELDTERQKFLIGSLDKVQLFITAAEMNDKLKEQLPKGNTFYIKKGKADLSDKI